jgi:hypothetical protein
MALLTVMTIDDVCDLSLSLPLVEEAVTIPTRFTDPQAS